MLLILNSSLVNLGITDDGRVTVKTKSDKEHTKVSVVGAFMLQTIPESGLIFEGNVIMRMDSA